ncbi:hypothetical protein D7I39_10870 [Allopusillimonas ginsengisoli]|nr:hypothetical protein D7I39_10870 [Allopusillimonas ginsengisoli]
MSVPAEMPTDPITDHIISTFWAAHRARRYLAGASGAVALPLSHVEIGAVVDAYGAFLPRLELDTCVLAVDQEHMDGGMFARIN